MNYLVGRMFRLTLCLTLAGTVLFGAPPVAHAGTRQAADGISESTFAIIDGERITHTEFKSFFARYARSKFYHGVPKNRLENLRGEAANAMVERLLLSREATRRGIEADTDAVNRKIAAFETKYKESEAWSKVQPQLPGLRRRMLDSGKIAALENEIRHVDEPNDDVLVSYYERNIKRFTEPARDHLNIILVSVPPSAPKAGWEEGRQRAEKLHAMLLNGARFADVARQHSNHKSASSGGDLGFVHKGMLSTPAQKAVENLKIGYFSRPVRVLEGYVIFRVIARKEAEVRSLTEVRERVRALYVRDESARKWRAFVAGLRKKADVVILGPDASKEK